MSKYQPDARGSLSGGILHFRVTPNQMHRLRAGAAQEGVSLADHVRGLIDDASTLREQLTDLRSIILDYQASSNSPQQQPEASALVQAATVETLLLLRQLVKPDHIRSAHASLARLSLSPIRSA